MTNEEALKRINGIKRNIEYIMRDKGENVDNGEFEKDNEALTIAAKMITERKAHNYDRVIVNPVKREYVSKLNNQKMIGYNCPICDYELHEDERFCSMCGAEIRHEEKVLEIRSISLEERLTSKCEDLDIEIC